MATKTDGEAIAVLEANMTNIDKRLIAIETSMTSLHGKVDTFSKVLMENYVAKATFEEYKKNKWMERIIIVLITTAISGLVAFFLRESGI